MKPIHQAALEEVQAHLTNGTGLSVSVCKYIAHVIGQVKQAKELYNQPITIATGEWYYMGCYIQYQGESHLPKFAVFKDDLHQTNLGTVERYEQALKLCEANPVLYPVIGLRNVITAGWLLARTNPTKP